MHEREEKLATTLKVLTIALTLVTIISISIGGANVLYEVKRDVQRVDGDIREHKADDKDQWAKAWESIENNEDHIQNLELQNARLETQYQAIMRSINELGIKIDKRDRLN